MSFILSGIPLSELLTVEELNLRQAVLLILVYVALGSFSVWLASVAVRGVNRAVREVLGSPAKSVKDEPGDLVKTLVNYGED